jgi:hypothetical protein
LKISYSKYKTFTDNPEKYRLYYEIGLTPEGDETPTLWNFGRRRGRCFHELSEGLDRAALVKEYGAEMVARCELMREAVPDLGELDWIERSFEVPIQDGKHIIIGRIDHRFVNRDGVRHPGDFKTTKGTRTKKELGEYFADLERSTQHHFYLRAAREWEASELFTYHVVLDRKNKDSKPTYVPIDLALGPAAVDRTMSSVYAACEAIEFLRTYGIEKPWPDSRKWGFSDDAYAGIAGRTIPKGAVPAGFTTRYREQIQTEDSGA